jgi:hypothetical protein
MASARRSPRSGFPRPGPTTAWRLIEVSNWLLREMPEIPFNGAIGCSVEAFSPMFSTHGVISCSVLRIFLLREMLFPPAASA